MADKGDFFRDLSFGGAPSEYRHFRRKILLHIASLEEKQLKLAGPRILTRLTGEAWRATEHLSVGDLRSEKGWLRVLRALDDHYRYLPETELNECVDEFLFHLKRRSGEGPTAFVSRFKSVLSRLEALIALEKQSKTQKRKHGTVMDLEKTGDPAPDDSDISSMESPSGPDLTKRNLDAATASAGEKPADREKSAGTTKGPHKTVGSFVGEGSPKRRGGKPPSSSSSHGSRGTQKADDERAQRKMMENLEVLEAGHLKKKPIFPSVILGHLFMRKYGLTREQRSQVIRSAGGSCRFEDVERVIRASDYEDRFQENSQRGGPAKPGRRDQVMVADDSSLSEPDYSSEDAMEMTDNGEDTEDEEYEEAFQVQKKARQDAKRAFRSYKDSRKKMKEIRKERQPYMPVVALPPGTGPAPSDALPVQPTFKYDKKEGKTDQGRSRGKGGRRGHKEEIHVVDSQVLTEFSYMVEEGEAIMPSINQQEILAVTVPPGFAVIDTGCTTSVIGAETAAEYKSFFAECGYPDPTPMTLPPVQLKGFNGVKSSTSQGIRWTVKLGQLWGTITTYVVPGQAPFLLSRRVLQGMEASIDLGKSTITSVKHGMHRVPLSQACNGHLLMPLIPEDAPEDSFEVRINEPNNDKTPNDKTPNSVDKGDSDPVWPAIKEPLPHTSREEGLEQQPLVTAADRRRHFQTVMKHTRYTQADVGTHRYPLRMLFGLDVDFALCAYRPRFERVPKSAFSKDLYICVAHLDPDGNLTLTPWTFRPASARRAVHYQNGACIFAFRHQRPEGHVPSAKGSSATSVKACPSETAPVVPSGSGFPSHDKPEPPETTFLDSRPVPPLDPANVPDLNQATEPLASGAPRGGATCDCCWAEPSVEHDPLSIPEESPEDLEAVYEEVDWVSLEHLPMSAASRSKVARQVEAVRSVPLQLILSSLRESPKVVEKELKEWLGPQSPRLYEQVGLIEVFTGRAPLSLASDRRRGMPSIRLGKDYGQDFTRAKDRRLLLLLIGWTRPKDVWFSWPCSCWGGWSRLNIAKGGKAAKTILAQRLKEKPFLRLFEQAWYLQTSQGGHVHAENPVGSLAWKDLDIGPAFEADFHMCAVGMKCADTGLPILKPTRVVTSDSGLAVVLRRCRCKGDHTHMHLEGSKRTRKAEVYPKGLCKVVTAYFASRDKRVVPTHDVFLHSDDEADSERESEPDAPAEGPEGPEPARARRVNYPAMIQKLHTNTGHASIPQMLRLAQRVRAPAAVVEAIKQFRCPICEELQVPPSHRVAALRHTEVPNQIVGVDVVQVELKRDGPDGMEEIKYNVMTVVDYASDFAQQIVLPQGSNVVSRAFHSVWCRPYGPPKIIYVDPDQRWVSGDFQRFLRQHSITLLDSAAS